MQSKLGSMKALEDREWLAHPSSYDTTGKKTVPFKDVINKLVENRFDYDNDSALKAEWIN